MEFTVKELVPYLEIRQQNIDKALKKCLYKLKEVEGSTKKVKHYKFEDLPERYQRKLRSKGVVPEDEVKEVTNISKANFTGTYILASPDKRIKAEQKCGLIKLYKKRDDDLNQQQWLDEILRSSLDFDALGKVTLKQLNDWLRKYNETEAAGGNVVECFIDKRGAKAGAGIKCMSDDMKKVAEAYFLKDTFITITEVHLNMLETFGELMPSYDVLNNYYKEWKVTNPLLYDFAQSPDDAKNKHKPAIGRADEKAKYRNHYWELDSTPADIICADGKRYSIMAALDIYSRRVVFHVSETSSAYSIAQLLRKAILTLGIPKNVVIDNGKDYTSNHFMSICYNLGINPIKVPPFSGEKKPHVERVFGRLSRELFMQVAGYVGSNVSQKAQIQARQSFAHKINSIQRWREELKSKSNEEKKLIKDAWKIKKENLGLELNVLKSAEQLQVLCDNWVKKLYDQKKHKGINQKPIIKWNKCHVPVETVPDKTMLNLLLGESFVRTVRKGKIRHDNCHYAHENLVELSGQKVLIQAPDDMGLIFVHDEKMKFICIAEDPQYTGQSRAMAKKSEKVWNALTRHLDKMIKASKDIATVTIEDRIEKAKDIIHSNTITVAKKTEVIEATIKNIPIIEAQEKEALEKSKKHDFKNKDENGLPQKVHESGRRPVFFKNRVERFVWILEHDAEWTAKDIELKEKYPKSYETAVKIAKVS